MNNLFKKIAFVVFAMIVCLSLVKETKVSALSPNYNMTNTQIYYFADSCPVINQGNFNSSFGSTNYSIVYDIPYYVDNNTLNDYYNNNYFTNFAPGTIVVFDLKTRLFDGNILNLIFEDIKLQGCYIIFISGYSESSYNTSVTGYIDDFIESEPHMPFELFVHLVVLSILNKHEDSDNPVRIILDYRFYDDPWVNSIFFQLILEEFRILLNLTSTDYDDIRCELEQNFNIVFIVSTEPQFYAILENPCNPVPAFLYELFTSYFNISNGNEPTELYAICISALEANFYSLLYNLQCNYYDLTVFIWEIDELIYGSGGLSVFTDSSLSNIYNYNFTNDYNILDEVIIALSNAIFN